MEIAPPDLHSPVLFGEGVHPAAVVDQTAHIDLADGQPRGKPPLRQQHPVFRNHVVAGKDQIGGGLPLPGVGVDVGAAQPPGLSHHQLPAVGGLAHHLVGGGEIQNHRGPRTGQRGGGGLGSPQILTDFHPYHKTRRRLALMEQPPGELYLLAAEHQTVICRRVGGKPPLFIEFAIVGNVRLGNHALDLASLNHHGAIVELAVPLVPHGHPQGRQNIQVFGGLQNGAQALLGPVQQGVLQKQVPAGVAGEAQLRQGQDFYPLLVRLPDHGKNLLGVVPAVRNLNLGRPRRHADKTVSHAKTSFPVKKFICPHFTPTAAKMQHTHIFSSGRQTNPGKPQKVNLPRRNQMMSNCMNDGCTCTPNNSRKWRSLCIFEVIVK